MRTYIKFLILLIPLINSIKAVNAQDVLDTKLKTVEVTYNKTHKAIKFFFDRYNCILSRGVSEIPIMEVKIVYEYTSTWGTDSLDFKHTVHISCIKFTDDCIFEPTNPKKFKKISGSYVGFDTKAEAFDFLNKFNGFIAAAKQLGFCEKKN